MERAIKFRGKASPRHPWVYGYYHLSYDGSLFNLISTIIEGVTHDYPVDERSVGQFTGLLDKNGNEIYEGDILSNSVAKWIVVFNTGCFCHKMVGSDERPTELALRSLIGGEVIGNVYENPELLADEVCKHELWLPNKDTPVPVCKKCGKNQFELIK